MSEDFDINKWDAGQYKGVTWNEDNAAPTGVQWNEDFDINKWENGNQKPAPNPTSVEGRPGVPKPQPPTLSPSEEMPVSQAEQDSVGAAQTAKQLGGPAAGGLAAGMAGPMVMALAPEVVSALSSAAAAHPLAAKIIAHGIEAAGLGAGWRIATKLFE